MVGKYRYQDGKSGIDSFGHLTHLKCNHSQPDGIRSVFNGTSRDEILTFRYLSVIFVISVINLVLIFWRRWTVWPVKDFQFSQTDIFWYFQKKQFFNKLELEIEFRFSNFWFRVSLITWFKESLMLGKYRNPIHNSVQSLYHLDSYYLDGDSKLYHPTLQEVGLSVRLDGQDVRVWPRGLGCF